MMDLLAHATINEFVSGFAVFLLGVVSGALLAWGIWNRSIRKDR